MEIINSNLNSHFKDVTISDAGFIITQNSNLLNFNNTKVESDH